jgi:diaminopimelate epimerase
MQLKFVKMSGAGNDFVVADNREGSFRPDPASVTHICDRRFGVGADGLLLVEPSKTADFFMRYYNADGSEAEMCGNGARCIARFYSERCGTTRRDLRFETRAGLIQATVSGSHVRLTMSEPHDLRPHQKIQLKDGSREYHFINTGVPHAVFFTDNADREMVQDIGAEVRHHKDFSPRGTNVDWVQPLGGDAIRVRTYERGVVASGIVAHLVHGVPLPVKVTVQSGRVLEVNFSREGERFGAVTLAGPAEYAFEGTLL